MKRSGLIKDASPFVALFLVCFAIFYGRLWLIDLADAKIKELARAARQNGAIANGLEYSLFPPRAKIDSIAMEIGGFPIILENIEIPIYFFPPRADASARILGGELKTRADLEIGFPPRISRVVFALEGVDLAKLGESPNLKNFMELESGDLGAAGDIEFAWKNSRPDWTKTKGVASATLRNGAIILKFPILSTDRLDNIRGDAAVKIAGTTLELTSCGIDSPPLSFEADGDLAPWTRPGVARINLKTEMRVPPELANRALVPPRTMEQIERRGLIRARVAGTVAEPKIYLEN